MTRLAVRSMTVAIAAIIAPSLACAQTAFRVTGDVASETVRYDDLNLKTQAGASHMMRRLDIAADSVCGGEPGGNSGLGARTEYQSCRAAALRAAIRQVDAPMLTALVEGARLVQLAQR
jgi:UrcA family protein